jgi:hypothetical protein
MNALANYNLESGESRFGSFTNFSEVGFLQGWYASTQTKRFRRKRVHCS